MKQPILLLMILFTSFFARAQKLDSLFFNLYTDSLKKGTYNYINVDGHYSNGNYQPLTADDLIFWASAGQFDRNSLFIDSNVKDEKVTIRITLKKDPKVTRETVIYIKKYEVSERLPTVDEIMKKPAPPAKKTKRKKA
ncbi:MAG TPA: hypothetical protein VLC28_02045 [Flavitalea sp.]|nr:hypothetical protein [Flavitalea sp.]